MHHVTWSLTLALFLVATGCSHMPESSNAAGSPTPKGTRAINLGVLPEPSDRALLNLGAHQQPTPDFTIPPADMSENSPTGQPTDTPMPNSERAEAAVAAQALPTSQVHPPIRTILLVADTLPQEIEFRTCDAYWTTFDPNYITMFAVVANHGDGDVTVQLRFLLEGPSGNIPYPTYPKILPAHKTYWMTYQLPAPDYTAAARCALYNGNEP